MIEQLADRRVYLGDHQVAQPHRVHEAALFVHDVKLVERFAFAADFPQMREHFSDSPTLLNGYVLRRHPPADRVFGVA